MCSPFKQLPFTVGQQPCILRPQLVLPDKGQVAPSVLRQQAVLLQVGGIVELAEVALPAIAQHLRAAVLDSNPSHQHARAPSMRAIHICTQCAQATVSFSATAMLHAISRLHRSPALRGSKRLKTVSLEPKHAQC